ncbi:MAG: sulfite exporter TauE/SafE family protein [Sphingomonadaceae bacterium]|nr:sulfite exporter TauE/SafE family protein [Sphingomonadaceae bacterium]
MFLLALGFLLTAALYASVGFAGGSTYTALLWLWKVDYRLLPPLSLLCNAIVATGGTIRFARAGLIPWRRVLPLVTVSAPLALLGGLTPIKEAHFLALLGASLLVAGLLLLFQRERAETSRVRAGRPSDAAIGGAVGYLSGVVGIGGGIFLAPILHLTRWGRAREIAATASLFILVNSIAGLIGQFAKLGTGGAARLLDWWPLFAAVLIGGQIGSHAGIKLLPPVAVRRATALLILYVAAQLLWRSI